MFSRRELLKRTLLVGIGLALPNMTANAQVVSPPTPPQPPTGPGSIQPAYATSSLDPNSITKFQTELLRPPAFSGSVDITDRDGRHVDYYEIGVRQFRQQILPAPMPMTTVWSYGPANSPESDTPLGYNYPAYTIEATVNKPVRVRWVNQLHKTVNGKKYFLPHLLPVDQTLHWANPGGPIDEMPEFMSTPGSYLGPVPMVTHVHGAHVTQESDGYPTAWSLPDADDTPTSFSQHGSIYAKYQAEFQGRHGVGSSAQWSKNSAVFQYPNDQRAATLWYHDHTLGMTRVNVYAGPAGYYILRGGADSAPVHGTLPEGAYEIPVLLQDRSFNLDTANDEAPLFFPDSRPYFDGFRGPFVPSSDMAPMWNPEFFGNTLVVNGNTWPECHVERRRYRIRFLNGCNARTMILKIAEQFLPSDPNTPEILPSSLPFWVIGTEGGFLPDAAVQTDELLVMPAERYDVIIDFSKIPFETKTLYLINEGPDSPFGGDPVSPDNLPDQATTGVVMRFELADVAVVSDPSADPTVSGALVLPSIPALAKVDVTRQVSLNELESSVLDDIGPLMAMLGTVSRDAANHPIGVPLKWMHKVTESIKLGDNEIWEIYNFTMDAHPIHLHQVMFKVLEREEIASGMISARLPWEAGYKDTVVSIPGTITRIQAKFDLPGRYVWHCHIIDHEDNEMMRPFDVLSRNYLPWMAQKR